MVTIFIVSELNRSGRKRSYTQNDAEEVRSKRSKLEDEKKSVDRLSRPRTLSATGKIKYISCKNHLFKKNINNETLLSMSSVILFDL